VKIKVSAALLFCVFQFPNRFRIIADDEDLARCEVYVHSFQFPNWLRIIADYIVPSDHPHRICRFNSRTGSGLLRIMLQTNGNLAYLNVSIPEPVQDYCGYPLFEPLAAQGV